MISSKFIYGLLLVVLAGGCSDASVKIVQQFSKKKSWHEKFNWKSEDYFEDQGVIELCRAIEANDLEAMQKLLDGGVDVNTKGKGNMTPLLWAFPDRKLERFELLMKAGADPNVYFESDFGVPYGFRAGDSVTHLACRSYFPYFDSVFEHGGDPNFPSKDSPLSFGDTPIFSVVESGGSHVKERLKLLLKKGADINYVLPDRAGGGTVAMRAASLTSQFDVCLFLLKNGVDPTVYQANYLQRLIHLLAKKDTYLESIATPSQRADYDRLVQWLEEHGESVEEAQKDISRWHAWIRDETDGRRKFLWAREEKENKRRWLEAKKQREAEREKVGGAFNKQVQGMQGQLA